MVEYSLPLDNIFGALADSTRRDILRRVADEELTISQLAQDYKLTFAAISKHLKVLEKAKLVVKRRSGRQQFVGAYSSGLKTAEDYLEVYRDLWEVKLEALDHYLNEGAG